MLFEEKRTLWFQTPTSLPGLKFLGFAGEEKLSGLFQFTLTFLPGKVCPPLEEVAENWMGKDIGFGLEDAPGGDFHGTVQDVHFDEGAGSLHVEVGPRLALLKFSAGCRTFVDKTVPQIAEEVFQETGLSNFEFRLGQRRYSKREICIQYGEADADFLMRLWEEEGIFFYFEFTRKHHRLILADHSPVLASGKLPVVPMRQRDSVQDSRGAALETWQWRRWFTPGLLQVTGHFPQTPKANLSASSPLDTSVLAEKSALLREGLSRVQTQTDAEELAKLRQQVQKAHRSVIQAAGAVCLRPGQVFLRDGSAEKYLVRFVRHSAQEGDNSQLSGYNNALECQSLHVPFRPAPTIGKPRLAGYQPAVVVGKDGTTSEKNPIFLDEFGRVRVRFRWEKKEDLPHAVPVRLVHFWPGSFGPPHPGQEVAIVFEDGDPDRPILFGLLPTAPKLLPHDPVKFSAGYSIRLPANPPSGNESEVIFQIDTASDKPKAFSQLPGHWFQRIAGEIRTWVGKTFSLKVVGNLIQEIGEVFHLHAQKEIVVQADQKITLKVGGSSIVITGAGITINGSILYLNSPGGPTPSEVKNPKEPEKPF